MRIIHFSIFLSMILIFCGGFLSESFAIDFVDSSGYTPSWAQGKGYHTVLVQCTQYSGDGSSDSYWCLEWMAYVLDQGVENFPQSTLENTSTTNIDSSALVKGDLYFGPLTKFLPPNSSYEKTWDPNLDWKPNLDNPGWVIGEPFVLPVKSTVETVGIIDNVAQAIFIPDISGKNSLLVAITILEFENNLKANDFFQAGKAGFLNKIESENSIEDISGQGTVYFDDCIAYQKNFDLADESSQFVCVRDKYLVSIAATQSGGYVTDNFYDYVLPSETAGDISSKIGKNIDITFQKIDDKKSGAKSITGKESCIALVDKAEWKNEACIAKVLNVGFGEILTIAKGVSLYNSEGIFRNSGTINVLGSINNWGTFENYGTINVSGQVSISESDIINKGAIMINDGSSVVVQSKGTLDNFGTISNNDQLINYGIINNHCDGVISGNPVGMRDFGIGKIPIKQISCEVISEKTSETTSSTPSETKTTSSSNIVSQEKIESSENSIAESGLNVIGNAMAALILIGMPVLFIVLIILKIKRRLPEGMFKKIMKIVGILFLALIVIGIILGALN